jgi:hypothetical protein
MLNLPLPQHLSSGVNTYLDEQVISTAGVTGASLRLKGGAGDWERTKSGRIGCRSGSFSTISTAIMRPTSPGQAPNDINSRRRKSQKRWQSSLPMSLIHCEPTFQTQTPRLSRQRGAGPGNSLLEWSCEPNLGFFPGDGSVRVGLQVPETPIDKGFFRIGQRPVIQPLVLGLDYPKTSDGALRSARPTSISTAERVLQPREGFCH